jgi:hypothetical protein
MAEGIYEQILVITSDYLGPASERFLRRQIEFHLGKDPDELTEIDVPRLAEWIKVSIEVLTESKPLVDEFDRRVRELSRVTG